MELTGCMPILERPLILKLRPQNAASDCQCQLRDVYLVALSGLGDDDEAILGGKAKAIGR